MPWSSSICRACALASGDTFGSDGAREEIGPISERGGMTTGSGLTLERALVPAELAREVRVLAARLRRLRGDRALRPRVRAGLLEHRARVGLGGLGHVWVCEGGAVAAEDAVVVLLERR